MRSASPLSWMTWPAPSADVHWRSSLALVVVTHLVTQGPVGAGVWPGWLEGWLTGGSLLVNLELLPTILVDRRVRFQALTCSLLRLGIDRSFSLLQDCR